MKMMIKQYIHADLDAFYASVEQLDNPSYRGQPVIVGGLPCDKRSVVSTASYEARKYGVHAGMPITQAYKLCSCGIFVRGNMERYKEMSHKVMEIFYDFTPDVQQMSIDEAFLDITGTERLFGPPKELTSKLQKKVFEKTGLTLSCGIATNKYVAKIASGLQKPCGCTYVERGSEEEFMLGLSVKKIWGAGKKTQEALKKYNLTTCKSIHDLSMETLQKMFGSSLGVFLYNAVRGNNATNFREDVKSHSISHEQTFENDLTDEFTIENALLCLSYKIMYRIMEEGAVSKTVFVKIRYSDFSTETVQSTQAFAFKSVGDLFAALKELFFSKYIKNRPIRLIGAGFNNVEKDSGEQSLLFDGGRSKRIELQKAIHEINKKFPSSPVKKARLTRS
ncbi:MAG: DNA polymerase IV [Termitinemataceae bacterium]|nr:MAG: DNA polymerase IV [Termitinemataceae bacterium]